MVGIRTRWLGVLAMAMAALVSAPTATVAAPLLDPDFTPPFGPFGFTTMGLGVTPSYGEPSLQYAVDGQHALVCTPGSDAAGNGGVQYWYSADNGATWGHSISSFTGGGGDCGLDILPNGTALGADLALTSSGITISHDFGQTWTAGTAAGMEQDRQWLAHTADGTKQFLVYHDLVLEGEFISVSTDGGQTWTTSPLNQILVNSVDQVSALPILLGGHPGNSASIIDQGVNTFSGPMLVDPNGKDFYVVYSISNAESNLNPAEAVPPFGPVRALVVAHSAGGAAMGTWTNVLADVAEINGTQESVENTLFPWGFLDSAGTVYVVFDSTRGGASGDHFHQFYVFSKDRGATWSQAIRIDTLPGLDHGAAAYATGDAVSPGVIDVAWYQSNDGTPSTDKSTWVPHFAQVTGADTATPQVVEQAITEVPNHIGGICLQGILCGVGPGSADRTLLDFFQLKVNPVTQRALIAYADNNRLGKSSAGG